MEHYEINKPHQFKMEIIGDACKRIAADHTPHELSRIRIVVWDKGSTKKILSIAEFMAYDSPDNGYYSCFIKSKPYLAAHIRKFLFPERNG